MSISLAGLIPLYVLLVLVAAILLFRLERKRQRAFQRLLIAVAQRAARATKRASPVAARRRVLRRRHRG